jgi:hypothetical protein
MHNLPLLIGLPNPTGGAQSVSDASSEKPTDIYRFI